MLKRYRPQAMDTIAQNTIKTYDELCLAPAKIPPIHRLFLLQAVLTSIGIRTVFLNPSSCLKQKYLDNYGELLAGTRH